MSDTRSADQRLAISRISAKRAARPRRAAVVWSAHPECTRPEMDVRLWPRGRPQTTLRAQSEYRESSMADRTYPLSRRGLHPSTRRERPMTDLHDTLEAPTAALGPGDAGAMVRALQERLDALGYWL